LVRAPIGHVVRATTVTTIALETAWPAVVAQTARIGLLHEHERREVTFPRP
jgi:hypothetical protein